MFSFPYVIARGGGCRNKTLVFAYLCVERGAGWFARVLQLSLGGAELRLNARNCVGTVLALNPHRKYFCIYHAKHPECTKPHKVPYSILYSIINYYPIIKMFY